MKIDRTQQNSKCRLCGDSDETIHPIISECNKLVQKEYKTWQDWMSRWSTRNYARNRILLDFEIQTDQLIPDSGPDLGIIKKKTGLAE